MIKYPKRIPLAQDGTPLEDAPRLTPLLGGPRLLIKRDDLTGSVLSGNKVRKIEFSLAEARARGADVIITVGGIQSNHCRATALSCARLGLACHLVLRGAPDGAPDGNLLLDYLAGAEVTYLPQESYSVQMPAVVGDLAAQYARAGRTAYTIPVGASNATGAWGYVRAYAELMKQAARRALRIDHIVSAVGSGGTTAGLIAGAALAPGRQPQVWGVNVCDDAPTFEREIRSILGEMRAKYALKFTDKQTPIRILDGYVGEGYAIPYDAEIALMKEAGRLEGLVLDPVYTGKAFHGLVEEARRGRFGKRSTVVFIHTGGVFGLFPKRAVFGFGGSAPAKPAPGGESKR